MGGTARIFDSDPMSDMGEHRKSMLVRSGVVAVILALVAALFLRHSRTTNSVAQLDAQLTESRRYADSLVHALARKPLDSVSATNAAELLYLERARLGLGSPFRLVDQALRDPLFTMTERRRLARAILALVRDGDAYHVAPEALTLVARTGGAAQAVRHLALVDSVVSSQRDPRVGELVIRLSYRLASASGAVSRGAPEIATNAAAQARDRVLAARDVRALLSGAARTGADLFAVLRERRDARRLAVEQPVIVPLTARAERAAVALFPRVVAQLEEMANPALALATGPDSSRPAPVERGLAGPIGEGLARRMALIAEQRDAPPLAAVAVSVAGYAPLIRRDDSHPVDRLWRDRFAARARNEESLAAEYALLRARASVPVASAAAAALTAAVALRPYAQERAWLYGDDAPTARDLQTRFGVTVSYDSAVRTWWRPYLRRTLAVALTDMRRVLSSYDPRGLRVHFGANPMGDRALALHDPSRRVIYFPVSSSAGVMAHEFAHDLDWLAARRHYNGSGWYRTDRAARLESGQLAGVLRQMASAARLDASRAAGGLSRRPTELFARNVDWFVSAALARDGRVNGYLSAVQDPVLVGYGSAATPETASDGGGVTLRALAEMTVVPDAVRDWFGSTFGAERRISVHEAVREVLEVPLPAMDLRPPRTDARWGPEAARALMRRSPAASGAWACLVPAFTEHATDGAAARAAMQYAAEARARGIVRQWRTIALRNPGVGSLRMRALAGGPWDPAITADLERDLRDAILWRAMSGRAEGIAGSLAASVALRAEAGCKL